VRESVALEETVQDDRSRKCGVSVTSPGGSCARDNQVASVSSAQSIL